MMNVLIAGSEFKVCKLLRNFIDRDHTIYVGRTVDEAAKFLIEEHIVIAFFDPTSIEGRKLAYLAVNRGVRIMCCEKLRQGSKVCGRQFGNFTCEHSICI